VFFIRLGNTNRVSLVDRTVVERVLREHSFQAGDWSNQQKTAELGTALNSDWIVRGEMEKFGNNILVTVQFYDIRTFRFMGGADLRLANADEAYDRMDPLVDKLVETISAAPARPATPAPAQSSAGTPSAQPPAANPAAATGVTYNIGDAGPAGGIVFYDKGNNNGGWRYLEAAPAATEFRASQGIGGQPVAGTQEGVGTGKENTQIILDRYKALGINNSAAHICSGLDINGYKDWFLPSMGELDLLYKNLKQKGLGGFRNETYWSSSHHGLYNAYSQGFTRGSQYSDGRNNSYFVRAVRAF
jgi:hypothetical protein